MDSDSVEDVSKLVKNNNKTGHKHPSSLRNERSGRKSSPQSEGRDSYRTTEKWCTRGVVGFCDGMLWMLAQPPHSKTASETRFGKKLVAPSIPCGTLVQYFPMVAKNKWNIHQIWRER